MTTFKVRAFFLCFCIASGFCVIVGRLFVIQVVKNEFYVKQSQKQTRERAMIPAKRGNIFDRKGQILATSVESRIKMALLTGDSDTETRFGSKRNRFVPIKRLYPNGECAGSVLGYIGKDGYGLAGVEYYFNRFLICSNST